MAQRSASLVLLFAVLLLAVHQSVHAAIDPSIQLTVNSTSIRDGDMVKVGRWACAACVQTIVMEADIYSNSCEQVISSGCMVPISRLTAACIFY